MLKYTTAAAPLNYHIVITAERMCNKKINGSLATIGPANLCLFDALLEVGDDRRRHVVAPQHVAQLLDLVELLQDGGVRLLHLVRQLQRRLREGDH